MTLGDVNFDNAVFNAFNMPPLHHIDYGVFVRAWKKEGTQRMGTLKGRAARPATTMAWTGLRSSAATCGLERGHR